MQQPNNHHQTVNVQNSWTDQGCKTNNTSASNLLFNMFSNSQTETTLSFNTNNNRFNQTQPPECSNFNSPTVNNNTSTSHHFFNLTQVNTPFSILNPNLLVHKSDISPIPPSCSKNSCHGSCDQTSSPSNLESPFGPISTNGDNVILMNNACIFCKLNHKKCDRIGFPPGCTNCLRSQKQCVYTQARKRGPKGSLPAANPVTGAVEYRFVDDSSTIVEKKKTKKKESPTQFSRKESRYINERAYLNNLRQIELDRKYFDNISLDVYKSVTYSMVPPSYRDELMYWLSVSITGRTDLDTDLEEKIDPREPLGNSKIALLYILHAISFFRTGNSGFAKLFYEKGRDFISKCFDQTNDTMIIYTYSLMAFYLLGAECGSESKCTTTTCTKAKSIKCYGECVSRSKYFYSICLWYLREREQKDWNEHCIFIYQGLNVVQLFYLNESVENEIENINKKLANNQTFVDISDFDEYSRFVVEKHISCLNSAVSSPVFNQIKTTILSKSGKSELFNLEEPVQQIMEKLDLFLRIFTNLNSVHTYTFLVVCLGIKAMILFKQHKHAVSSSVDMLSAANEITKSTQSPFFKYCQIATIYSVEVAAKIHYDVLSNLLNDPSINLLYDYVEELSQYLYQDLRNLNFMIERSPLIHKRYLHLQMHVSFCLDLYEETKRNHPHRFLHPTRFNKCASSIVQ